MAQSGDLRLPLRRILAYEHEANRRKAAMGDFRAEAQREPGLALRDLGRAPESRAPLARYLQLAPTAKDRGIVESYLR